MPLGLTEMTEEQEERVEALRRRLDSAYGTDGAHWVAAAEMVLSGILDEMLDEARASRALPLADLTEFQITALASVVAQDVWDAHEGARTPWVDLGPVTQDVRRSAARRHLEALARFLTR